MRRKLSATQENVGGNIMEYVFMLYILAGLFIMWIDRDKRPVRRKETEKDNVIRVDFPQEKKVI